MKIAVLGCGNMASAIVLGLAKEFRELSFFCYTPSVAKAKDLAAKVKGEFFQTPCELPECDLYVIGCKPQQFESFCQDFKNYISSDSLVLSMMAGVKVSKIQTELGVKKVIRLMPNTPTLIGQGCNTFYFDPSIAKENQNSIKKYFNAISKVFIFNKEEQIELTTPYNGSGPAYIFEFARLMIQKLESEGIEKSMAKELVVQTFVGASLMMQQSEDDPETLRDKVTSKKGVTYEALESFKEHRFEQMVNQALEAAHKRALELAK